MTDVEIGDLPAPPVVDVEIGDLPAPPATVVEIGDLPAPPVADIEVGDLPALPVSGVAVGAPNQSSPAINWTQCDQIMSLVGRKSVTIEWMSII